MSKNSKISNLSPASGPTRIVHDQAKSYQAWTLPTFDEHDGHIIESAEKKQQDKDAAEVKDNEIIEDVVEIVAPLTAAELDEITRTAQKEGYQVGYDEGHGQGLSAGMNEGLTKGEEEVRKKLEPELQRQAQLFSKIGNQMSSTFAQQQNELQPLLMDMVVGLAAQFIQSELQTSPLFLVGLIKDSVDALPSNGEDILIEINPEQRSLIAEHIKIDGVEWELKDNSALGTWDCKVSTSVSQVELDFQQRWKSLIEQFRAGRLVADTVVVEDELVPELLSAENLFSSPAPSVQNTATLDHDIVENNDVLVSGDRGESHGRNESTDIVENTELVENTKLVESSGAVEPLPAAEPPADVPENEIAAKLVDSPPTEPNLDDAASQSNVDANISPE